METISGRVFVIRSDQKSLKELLQQVVQTPDQQLYVRKLMGYKFTIEYKKGSSNKAADVLSRREESTSEAATSEPQMRKSERRQSAATVSSPRLSQFRSCWSCYDGRRPLLRKCGRLLELSATGTHQLTCPLWTVWSIISGVYL